MKNILKKIGYSLIVVTLVFGYVTVSDMVFAAASGGSDIHVAPATGPTDDTAALNAIRPILHSGGGHQVKSGKMSLSQTIGATFETINSLGKPSVFERSANVGTSFFAVLGNSWIGEKMFIGIPRSAFEFAIGNPFTIASSSTGVGHFWMSDVWDLGLPSLQKVNVNGNVLATNVAHPITDSDNVCLDQFGSLVLCGTFSCTGSAPSNATMCSGDNANLSIDTANTLGAICGSPKCEFTCINGYSYDLVTDSCVADSVVYECEGQFGGGQSTLSIPFFAASIPQSCQTSSSDNDSSEIDYLGGYYAFMESGGFIPDLNFNFASCQMNSGTVEKSCNFATTSSECDSITQGGSLCSDCFGGDIPATKTCDWVNGACFAKSSVNTYNKDIEIGVCSGPVVTYPNFSCKRKPNTFMASVSPSCDTYSQAQCPNAIGTGMFGGNVPDICEWVENFPCKGQGSCSVQPDETSCQATTYDSFGMTINCQWGDSCSSFTNTSSTLLNPRDTKQQCLGNYQGCTWTQEIGGSPISCAALNPSDQNSCETQGNGTTDCVWTEQ